MQRAPNPKHSTHHRISRADNVCSFGRKSNALESSVSLLFSYSKKMLECQWIRLELESLHSNASQSTDGELLDFYLSYILFLFAFMIVDCISLLMLDHALFLHFPFPVLMAWSMPPRHAATHPSVSHSYT